MSMSKSDNAEIAVLQTQMEDVKASVSSIETKVDKLLDRFEITVNSFVSKAELKKIVNDLESELEAKIKAARNFNWVTHSLTAVLTVILTVLIYYFVSHGNFIK